MTVTAVAAHSAGWPRMRRRTPGARNGKCDPPGTSTSLSTAERSDHLVPSSAWFGPSLGGKQERELLAFLGSHNGVAVLQWPRDADHLQMLATAGIPRLLLVHPSPTAPPPDEALQLSIGYPSAPDEIHGALVVLCRRAAFERSSSGRPIVDAGNCLRAGDGTVEIPAATQALVRLLVEHFSEPVDDAQLLTVDQAGSSVSRSGLDGQLACLCQLVNPLGLEVVPKPGPAHALRWCAA